MGELLLWRLETGQPYKKFVVSNPTERIKIHFTVDKVKERRDDLDFYMGYGFPRNNFRALALSPQEIQLKERFGHEKKPLIKKQSKILSV